MDIRIKPLRISDALTLWEAGIFANSVKGIEKEIRKILSDDTRHFYLVQEGERNHFFSLCGLSAMEQFPLSAMYTTYEKKEPNHYCEKVLTVSGAKEKNLLRNRVLNDILHKAFFTHGFHRVNWILAVNEVDFEKTALKCGMHQKAVLEELDDGHNGLIDGGLFSISSVEFPEYGVGFVPYEDGIAAVYGNQNEVTGVGLYSYEDTPENDFTRRAAYHMGLLNEAGQFLGKKDISDFSQEDFELPAEVKKGVQELFEYFSKSRTRFTVNIKPSMGTDFQRRVWSQLILIPYGQTVSYADISSSLSDGTMEARKLNRAVGGACGANPCPIFVPCHRVIGKNKHLIGFSSGLGKKAFLLEHEIFGLFRNKG